MKTDFSVKIYSDGAVLEDMIADLNSGLVTGFTINPSLMKKAGVTDYLTFAQNVLEAITEYPVSFEVFADDLETMKYEETITALVLFGDVFITIISSYWL